MAMANHAKLYDDGVAMAKKPVKPPVERYEGKNVEKTVPKAIGQQKTAGMQRHIKLAFSAFHFSANYAQKAFGKQFPDKTMLDEQKYEIL